MKRLGYIAIFSLFFASCSTIVHGPAEEEKNVLERGDKPRVTEIPLGGESDHDKGITETKEAVAKDPFHKKRVYILKVLNRSPYGGDTLAQFVHDEVTKYVKSLPDYEVVGEVDHSEDFVVGGEYFFRSIFDRTRNQNIQGIITVQVDDVLFKERGDELGFFRSRIETAEAKVKVQMYDAVTEREVYSRMGIDDVTEEFTQVLSNHSDDSLQTYRSKRALQKAIVKATLDLDKQSRKIGWQGMVVKVDFHRIYINAGEASGLIRGQMLNVYSPADMVVDPLTRDPLGYGKGTFKGIVKVIAFTGNDLAVAVQVSGGGFRELDRIELSHLRK